jgi:protocatechuate 3,4-dioxygenase beta subunit
MQTGNTRTYEGRPYDRPDEELVDQGLAFDIRTLLSRRGVLVAGAGLAVAGLAACREGSDAAAGAGEVDEIPEETAGPYPGDGSNGVNALEESGVVRSDIRSSFGTGSATAEGIPMTLELTVHDLANGNARFAGVAVYVWHCDREGEYSMYAEGLEGENYLRGVQVADEDGLVRFTSVFPACYSGRWPHIHFEVYPDAASIADSANAIATSQVAIPEDVCDEAYAESGYERSVETLAQVSLDSDNVFGDDGGESQLAQVTGDASSGYTVALAVGVDTGTEAGGGAPGGGEGMPSGEPPTGRGGPGGA